MMEKWLLQKGILALFLFFSKDPKMDNSMGELGTEAKLTVLSLEMLFLFHGPQRQMADTCVVEL